jgi:hypothetical protein
LLGVDAALDSWITAGRIANKFEYDFAQYFGLGGQIVLVDISKSLIH